ncbi:MULTISPECIES: TetR/AcrR family transcriptional regulator [Streptomonospora]|uniref:TetR/AcrR family transcriptional regulator n=2 Tax=Streptomonospora TaxID=104204 RepID=A0ABV9SQS8_9ACTN
MGDAEASLRRTPVQRRSRQRVEALMAAAEGEFARVGFDGAGTTGIAARAGCSVGSLYQFFPHKGALLEAVVRRHGAELDRVAASALDAAGPGPAAVHRALSEGVLDYASRAPAVRALLCPTFASPVHAEAAAGLQQAMARRLAAAFGGAGVDPDRCAAAAAVYVESLAGLLARAVDAEGGRDPVYGRELAAVLGAYADALAR